MYEPVDRSSRIVDALFRRGEKARPVVPPVIRKHARAIVQRRLRSARQRPAPMPRNSGNSSRAFSAADRDRLESLGVDISRWGS